jgi:hypothetical protein
MVSAALPIGTLVVVETVFDIEPPEREAHVETD